MIPCKNTLSFRRFRRFVCNLFTTLLNYYWKVSNKRVASNHRFFCPFIQRSSFILTRIKTNSVLILVNEFTNFRKDPKMSHGPLSRVLFFSILNPECVLLLFRSLFFVSRSDTLFTDITFTVPSCPRPVSETDHSFCP